MSFDVICGDALAVLQTLPSGTADCCVTSPPYFGLRDYGVDGQIGLEPTPDEYIARLVDVFSEVRRVLRDDGTLWLNIGDSYANDGKWGGSTGGKHVSALHGPPVGRTRRSTGLKPKDLIGIPWMLAFALRADGWYLRQDIIWHKPAPMPESVQDRCTKAHEYVFLLSKSERYYYDSDAVKEKSVKGHAGSAFHTGKSREHQLGRSSETERIDDGRRNRRSVWTVPPNPYTGAHFAVMPAGLAEPCILAGSRVGGTVLDPFAGAGTTGLMAMHHGRNFLGIELNKANVDLIHQRVREHYSLFVEATA